MPVDNVDIFGAVLERAACTFGTRWELWAVLLTASVVVYVASYLVVKYIEHLIRFVLATIYYLSLAAVIVCTVCLATTLWMKQQEHSCANSQSVGSIDALVTAFLWQRFSGPHLSTLDIPDCIRHYME